MKHRISLILSALILLTTFVGAIAWDVETPKISDDWPYSFACPENFRGFWKCASLDRPVASLADAWESCVNHYTYANGRLANFIHIFWQPAGRHAEAVFLGFMIGVFGLLLAYWPTRGRRRISLWAVMLSTSLLWILYPWFDNFQSFAYQSNYVLVSAMIIALLLWFRRLGTMKTAEFFALCAFAFLTGWMHEGFSVVLIAWIGVAALLEKERLARRRLWITLAVVAAAFLICGPLSLGTRVRLTTESDALEMQQLLKSITIMLSEASFGFIVALLLLIKIYRVPKGERWKAFRPYAPYVAAMITGLAMPVVLANFHRVMWPFFLFCSLVLTDVVVPWLDRRIGTRPAIAFAVVFAGVYCWWFGQLVHWQKILTRQQEPILAQLERRLDKGEPFCGVVYVDMDTFLRDDDVPWYLFNIVRQPAENFLTNDFLASAYGGPDGFVLPVDESLRGKPFDQWPRLPGSSGVRGSWPYIFLRQDEQFNGNVTFGEPTAKMAPLDRLLMNLRGAGGMHTQTVATWPKTVVLPDGDSVIWHSVRPIGRTLRHREIIAIGVPQQ